MEPLPYPDYIVNVPSSRIILQLIMAYAIIIISLILCTTLLFIIISEKENRMMVMNYFFSLKLYSEINRLFLITGNFNTLLGSILVNVFEKEYFYIRS